MLSFQVPSGRRHVNIIGAEAVGNYGLRIAFDDLHSAPSSRGTSCTTWARTSFPACVGTCSASGPRAGTGDCCSQGGMLFLTQCNCLHCTVTAWPANYVCCRCLVQAHAAPATKPIMCLPMQQLNRCSTSKKHFYIPGLLLCNMAHSHSSNIRRPFTTCGAAGSPAPAAIPHSPS